MMLDFLLIVVPMLVMAFAYVITLHTGFLAGDARHPHRLTMLSLLPCVVLMTVQATLWVLWGLRIGGVI